MPIANALLTCGWLTKGEEKLVAMFHFRLKSDKKPDGTRISPIQHVDYIRREGNFAEDKDWKENNKFVGNFISSAEVKNACKDFNSLLYKTDNFGSIRNSQNGIEVTEKASLTTIAIALMLADETMNHKPLIISGSNDFIKKVIVTAVFDNLPISFADKRIQNEFRRQKEKNEIERRNFISNGGKIFTERPNSQSFTSIVKTRKLADVTKRGFCLPTLSKLNMVHSESQGTDVLLSADESGKLEQLAKNSYPNVRWDFSQQFLNLDKQISQQILQNIEEKLDNVYAESHVEYINREKAFESRGGCIFHSHHLPKWAKDDPKKFFKAADKYEGVGNRRYMEIEFALPNELKTVEEYRQIIDAFLDKHLSNHYYAYAIHEKIGMLSEEQRHPHVHIMFSERLIDDVEKVKERPAKYFFSYPARKKKDGTEPTFEEKYKHGAPKNRNWAEKSFLAILRSDFAKIQNEVLEKNGFSIRVDHRTLKAQKEEAEKNGDSTLAKLFNRIPEEYIGVISCKEDTDLKFERLKKFRSLRNQHFDLIFKTDSATKKIEELETKDEVQIAIVKAREFITSEEFLSQKFDTPKLQELKAKVMFEIEEVNHWKRAIISQHNAEENAKLEYMNPAEREIWRNYFEILAQKKQLENFLLTLKKTDESQKDAINAYDEMVNSVKSKIGCLLISAASLKKSVDEINKKLDTPDFKKNIMLVTHQILQANSYARKMLKMESEKLNRSIDDLKDAIFLQSLSDKDYYKTREVYNIIRHQYLKLKKEYEKVLDLKYTYRQKIISPLRAVAMAKNIFVKGDLKKLRLSLRQYKKDAEKFSRRMDSFYQQEKIFQNTKWIADNQADFIQKKYSLAKEKVKLEIERNRLDDLKFSLEKQKSKLEEICNQPESVKQIQLIAAAILRKNRKFVDKLAEVDKKLQGISERLKHTKAQIDVVELQLKSERRTTYYKVFEQKYSNKTAASLIADAILREPQAAQLVARSSSNNLEMEKTWELMSDLDKDAIRHQKIFRNL